MGGDVVVDVELFEIMYCFFVYVLLICDFDLDVCYEEVVVLLKFENGFWFLLYLFMSVFDKMVMYISFYWDMDNVFDLIGIIVNEMFGVEWMF